MDESRAEVTTGCGLIVTGEKLMLSGGNCVGPSNRPPVEEVESRRYAVTVCLDCQRGTCPGHLADDAIGRYATRVELLERRLEQAQAEKRLGSESPLESVTDRLRGYRTEISQVYRTEISQLNTRIHNLRHDLNEEVESANRERVRAEKLEQKLAEVRRWPDQMNVLVNTSFGHENSRIASAGHNLVGWFRAKVRTLGDVESSQQSSAVTTTTEWAAMQLDGQVLPVSASFAKHAPDPQKLVEEMINGAAKFFPNHGLRLVCREVTEWKEPS